MKKCLSQGRIKVTTLLCVLTSILFLTGCDAIQPISFPEQLFHHDEPQNDPDRCFVQVEEAKVVIPESAAAKPILQIGGQITSTCGQLQVKIDKPDLNNEIAIDLAAEPGPGDQSVTKPFFISITLENLWSASFTLVINANRRVPFTVP